MFSDLLVLVRFAPALIELLRLRRAALKEPHREQEEERELEVLRLPVLHHVDAELGRHDVARQRHLGIAVADRLFVEVRVPRDGLAHQGGEEQQQEDDREAVLLEEAAHQLCMNPIAV
jgi:hypothetical protein